MIKDFSKKKYLIPVQSPPPNHPGPMIIFALTQFAPHYLITMMQGFVPAPQSLKG